MAVVDLAPANLSLSGLQSNHFTVNIPTNKLSDGTAQTLSAPFALRTHVFPSGGSGSASPLASPTATLTMTAGNCKMELTAAAMAAIPVGSWSFTLDIQNLTGDDFQNVASGSFTVSPDA